MLGSMQGAAYALIRTNYSWHNIMLMQLRSFQS